MKIIFFILLGAGVFFKASGQGTFNIPVGASVKASGNAFIVIDSSHLVNNGSLQMASGDGTVKFTGAGDVNLSGNGTTNIDRLHIAKAGSSNITLQSNIGIITQINFTSGLLNLGNNMVDLGTTGVLTNEGEGSRAFTRGAGYIQANSILNAPSSLNPGNLGAIISSSQNLGNTTIKRGNSTQVIATGKNSIARYFDITPTNNTGLNATLHFQYFDAELNSLPESSLAFWKTSDNVSWSQIGSTSRDATGNYVEKTGINDFSRWTLAQESLTTYYQDKDGDGCGNPAVTTQASAPPSGYVTNNGDCDDTRATTYPSAQEICGNGIDDNCNGQIDEGCTVSSTLSINDVAMNEGTKGKSNMTFTVTLNKAYTKIVTVQYTTQNVTAAAGSDYTAKSGTLTFKPGSTKQTIAIPILGDKTVEPDETFMVVLSNPVNAVLLKGAGTGTILNDDALATVAAPTVMNKASTSNEMLAAKLSVQASPNPSSFYFNIVTKSSNTQVLYVRVFDALGRLIEIKNNIPANGTLRIGDNYRPGIYFVEVIQGNESTRIQIIKSAN